MLIYHRHINGGGAVHTTAEVCPQSYLDKISTADAGSLVVNSFIVKSWIGEGVKAINSRIEDSKLNSGSVLGGVLNGCTINGGTVLGGTFLNGITVQDQMRIGHGNWNRQPRFFVIDDGIAHLGVTESTSGEAYIGCIRKPMRTWIRGKNRFGKAVGWKQETLDLLEQKFTEWLDNPIPTYTT